MGVNVVLDMIVDNKRQREKLQTRWHFDATIGAV